MTRVAIATCAGDNVDPDAPLLLDALEREGLAGELCVWDDPRVDWNGFELTVVRSTWDYALRRDEFLDWARPITRLCNPYWALEYSTDKHYLDDLHRRGYHVVPSQFCDVGVRPVFPEGDFVIKPCVGAGSVDAERYRGDELDRARAHVARLHALGRDALIQPYVASVDDLGERALVFLDGSFSHAVTKGAMLNVPPTNRHARFRREQVVLASGEPDAVAFARAVLDDVRFDELLYARVDLVRLGGAWALMELELVEPSLFLSHHGAAATQLARAIGSRAA